MRSSLSCDFCRKSKIKCVNSGSAPCQRCRKAGTASDCTLTRPRPGISKNGRSRSEKIQRRISDHQTSDSLVPAIPLSGPEALDGAEPDVDRHIASLPQSIILKTLNVFMNKFPELAFVHVPTFMEEWQSSRSKEMRALLAAILAVTKGQLTTLKVPWAEQLFSDEVYAKFAKRTLSDFFFQSPKIQVVQALLITALHEWGCRNFHSAWIYCGIAIRIMQALHSSRAALYALETTSSHKVNMVSLAVETRTFWGCFIMNCMINSGTYNPPMLPMSEMHKLGVAPPLSAVEFAFGPDLPIQQSRMADEGATSMSTASSDILDITQSFQILVSGFNVWFQVMTFIFNDGRRAPGMCAPRNCPWVPGSPWFLLITRLEEWRAGQHHRLHYPTNSVAAHMALGYAESFVYLNLLYYLCTLMLHREYFPFLPTSVSKPRGPVDHPTLEAEAPDGWWESSAQELFKAAENITKLLHEASECGVPLITPFAGFCAFSACFLNLYVFRFPQMNLGRSTKAEEHLRLCLEYLEGFRHVWKLGDGWLKTVQNASVLYGRAAADRKRYEGKTRADFDVLHQSVHEFRILDRSNEQIKEIEDAEKGNEDHTNAQIPSTPDENAEIPFLNQLLADVGSTMDEGSAWSYWWPSLEEIDLGATGDHMVPG